jgi:hypothetical protein
MIEKIINLFNFFIFNFYLEGKCLFLSIFDQEVNY